MIQKLRCGTCNKPVEVIAENIISGTRRQMYKCGHVEAVKQISGADFDAYISEDGHKPYKFQIDSALFGIEANGRVLFAHEMGLGKTVIASMMLWAHPKEMLRAVVFCKAGLKEQWRRMISNWNGESWGVQIVDSEKDALLPGAVVFIVSFDTLWRFKDIPNFMERIKAKTVVLDEVQHLKNRGAKRTQGIQLACRQVPYIIALSGTPIANNSEEYFTILNILYPKRFSVHSDFVYNYVEQNWNGYNYSYGGLKSIDRFENDTKDFILRFTRKEVLPDLPDIFRDFRFSELGDEVNAAYQTLMRDFQQYYYYGSAGLTAFQKAQGIMAYLARMRHLTGVAKIEPCVQYLSDFAESTDRKIVVFTHHKDVAEQLHTFLKEEQQKEPIKWGGEILRMPSDPAKRDDMIDKFRDSDSRILLVSELADCEGKNLQFCADAVMLERQWTPIKEEQAEARFPRPGQKANAINIVYMIAVGTVDEYLTKIEERKRSYVASAVDHKAVQWDEAGIVKELAEVLASTGGKGWSHV